MVAILLAISSNVAHEGKDHDEKAPAQDEEPTRDIADRLDSLFARIDTEFQAVKPILQKDCYNCHSNTIVYPWYYRLPLVQGLIDQDNEVARGHLDFSDPFPFGGHGSPLDNLAEIKRVIEEDEMPIFLYRLMHPVSLIEGGERDLLFLWIDSSTAKIRQLYEAHNIPY